MAKVTVTEEMLDQVRNIPAGAMGVESNKGLIQDGIKVFYIVRILTTIIVHKLVTPANILKLLNALFTKLKVNHVFTYWGSGDNVTVDALPQGVRKGNLIKKIENGSKLAIFYNRNVTIEGIMMAKSYSYGTVGRLYAYPDFVSFVTDLVKEIFPKFLQINSSPFMDHCAENSTVTQDILLTVKLGERTDKLLPNITDRSKVHPQDVLNYVTSPEGISKGWVKCAEFNQTK